MLIRDSVGNYGFGIKVGLPNGYNHGGGYVLIGFEDGVPARPAEPRPQVIGLYSSDAVNAVVARYADPPFHCDVHIVRRPNSDLRFPIVVVPGGSSVPVRSRGQSPDQRTLQMNCYYTRRPGPASEPPQNAHEWDALIRRCIAASKDEMLRAIRAIVTGEGAAVGDGATDALAQLRSFRESSLARWDLLRRSLPADADARLPHGSFVFTAQLDGQIRPVPFARLIEILRERRNYSGWPPLAPITRAGVQPYKIGDLLESWQREADASHADFWRISQAGLLLSLRGYREDSLAHRVPNPPAPGAAIELTQPIWQVAEFVLRVFEVGQQIVDGDFSLRVLMKWDGLAGRKLFSLGNRRMLLGDYVCHGDTHETQLEIEKEGIVDALPETVYAATAGLYEMFGLFELPRHIVDEEVAQLMRGNF